MARLFWIYGLRKARLAVTRNLSRDQGIAVVDVWRRGRWIVSDEISLRWVVGELRWTIC
jgi:hypothetical protein